MKPYALIPTNLNGIAVEILEANGYTVVQDASTPIAELAKAHDCADALIVRSEAVDADVMIALPNLKVIVRAGAGFDTIDVKHARRNNIDVMNTPGANANAVAEEVITLVLAVFRHVIAADASVREGRWDKKIYMGRELSGKIVGVIGLGHIGQVLIRRLSGFEVTVLGYDPMLSTGRAEELGVEMCCVEEIFEKADIVTLHLPETKETAGMVNRALLERMKPRAVLVNCARASVVNLDDLRAVQAEKELFYCNDVYEKDEPGAKPQVDVAAILMPHLGASTEEANTNAARRAAEQLVDYFERGVHAHVVNRGIPEGLDEGYQLLAFYLAKLARAYLGNETRVRHIEASFYGDLEGYAKWFLPPIVSGLTADFDPMFEYQDAEAYLTERGITFARRVGDERKGYGNSMTVDLFEDKGSTVNKVSFRGTLTEGHPMVSRIDDFDRLYFDPIGKNIIVRYKDQPGMLARITPVIARHGINIEDLRAPHDLKSGDTLAVFKVNTAVSQEILDEIKAESGAAVAAYAEI